MCGIVGYTGSDQARDFLIEGLGRLEYRGYDSAGIAVLGPEEMAVMKTAGKVARLASKVNKADMKGTTGIGHTRWATHGIPSQVNAHPHVDCSGKLAIVHNGIIENYRELRDQLKAEGHIFVSETDTEVIAHTIESLYEGEGACKGDLLASVQQAAKRFEGAYGLAVIHEDHPGQIVVTRKDSPIAIASTGDACYLASDAIPLVPYSRKIHYPAEQEVCVLHEDGTYECYDAQGQLIAEPHLSEVEWDISDIDRQGYEDYMLKEIFEQPRVLGDVLEGRIDGQRIVFDDAGLSQEFLKEMDRIYIIACGTSYHAGLFAKHLLDEWTDVPCEVEVASEFRYRHPSMSARTLVIAISQSGETADTLAGIQLAKERGAFVLALTNSRGSRITRESDASIYIRANVEIAVAATKSFTAQMVLLALLSLYIAQERDEAPENLEELLGDLQALPRIAQECLDFPSDTQQCARTCANKQSMIYLGRGVNTVTCMEGALKLKEISYVHAEAFSAGEIKHGPIALVDDVTPVVVVAVESVTYSKIISNIEEIQARGAKVIAVGTEGDEVLPKHADFVFSVPRTCELLSPITAILPLQLLSYYVAKAKGCNVDQPRNLAKSVTVE